MTADQKLRLVAIDLDDTLLRPDRTISQRVKRSLSAVQAMGCTVTLATGRMFKSAKQYADELELDVPLITYQGALVKTSRTGETLRSVSLAAEVLQPLLRWLEEVGVHINLYVGDDLYVAELNRIAMDYARFTRVDVQAVGQLSSFPLPVATKVVAVADPDYLRDHLQPQAERQFGDRLTINRSRPHFLEFGHPQATKSQALAFLANRLGIGREQVMAIGDGENDLDMLQYAGVGVAMGNAEPAALAVADFVTKSNQEDGVAVALEHYFRLG
ncbi:MAG: Cof-type HAD-IIB family hydrolase [Bacillota bacterium]|jgi:Cof subfamily protein (haloacid dehalogenase superfamily)